MSKDVVVLHPKKWFFLTNTAINLYSTVPFSLVIRPRSTSIVVLKDLPWVSSFICFKQNVASQPSRLITHGRGIYSSSVLEAPKHFFHRRLPDTFVIWKYCRPTDIFSGRKFPCLLCIIKRLESSYIFWSMVGFALVFVISWPTWQTNIFKCTLLPSHKVTEGFSQTEIRK